MDDFTLVTKKKGRGRRKDDKNTTSDVIPHRSKLPTYSDGDEKDAYYDRESFERSVLQITNCRLVYDRKKEKLFCKEYASC